MIHTLAIVATLCLCATPALAQDPTAEEILAKIDGNMTFESRTSKTKMTVVNPRRTREFIMISFGRGEDHSAIEYTSPARDKGNKMLRKADEVWTYFPSVERTQKISGHMLRKGISGSDVSYEDMMSASDLRSAYKGKVIGKEEIEGRPAWKLELVATDDAVTYPKRTSWVDVATHIPVKQELYALSGMLIKTWEMKEIKEFEGGRHFPTKMIVSDKLQDGTYTTLEFLEMTFGVELEDEVFTLRWLERK